MTHQPSRRSFIAGASLVALSPVAAQAATAGGQASAPSNPRLGRTIALHARAMAAAARFDDAVHTPALKAFGAHVDAYPVEPEPPHEEVETTFENWDNQIVRLSTKNVGSRGPAERVVNDPTWGDMGDEDWRQAFRELYALHQRRDAVIAKQKARREAYKADARDHFQIKRLAERERALADRAFALWEAVLDTPAFGLGDVLLKVAWIESLDDERHEAEFAAIAADIKRLASGAAG